MSPHAAGTGLATSNVFDHLDGVVERLARERDGLLADRNTPNRAVRLAALFEAEARAWSQVFEMAHLRLIWRAALAAEAGARANAVLWAGRAATARAGWTPPPSWTAGQVTAPRPVALTTPSNGGGDR